VPLYNALEKESNTEFFFLEGEYNATPVEEITQFYQGPYLSFYPWPPRMEEDDYNESKERAYELIYEAIEEDGPFDAILGFSQGASLAYLFLQQHARKHPFDPPWSLFRCAIFICGMPPFRIRSSRSSSQDRVLDPPRKAPVDAQELSQCLSSITSRAPPSREDSLGSDSSSSQDEFTSSNSSRSTISPASSVTSLDPNDTSFTLESDDLDLVFDEDFRALQIPSVHIGGKSDKVYDLTMKLYAAMNKDNALWIEHEQGHTIPWDKHNTQVFVDAIAQLERKAMLT
jgi:pimeloyl-ACP methyl ester carboxylesterase